LLIYRLIIVNLLGLVLVGYAQANGWIDAVVMADHTGVVWVVIAFFAAFMVSLGIRAGKVSKALNALKRGETLALNREKFIEKAAHLDDMPGWILLIGLIGNVLGIMLSIDNANIGGGDAQSSITGLLGSMDVAFGATIVSGVLGTWADINRRILKTATVCMLADHEEASELHEQMVAKMAAPTP
jgi:hypothetical protein